MNDGKKKLALFGSGLAAGFASGYAWKTQRARKPVTQAVTIHRDRATVESWLAEHRIGEADLREAPGRRGTELRLSVPGAQKDDVKERLRRVKALLEAGELPVGGMP